MLTSLVPRVTTRTLVSVFTEGTNLGESQGGGIGRVGRE